MPNSSVKNDFLVESCLRNFVRQSQPKLENMSRTEVKLKQTNFNEIGEVFPHPPRNCRIAYDNKGLKSVLLILLFQEAEE